jgi:hypothetical protein
LRKGLRVISKVILVKSSLFTTLAIEEANVNESRTFCLNLLTNLQTAKISDVKISDIQDIQPHMMSQLKNQYSSLVSDYVKTAKGPFKSEALVEVFEVKVLEDMATLIKDIEQAYSNSFNKVKLMISDYTRSEAKLQSLINQ